MGGIECGNQRDYIDSTDLLEHLIDVAKNRAVEITVIVKFEAV